MTSTFHGLPSRPVSRDSVTSITPSLLPIAHDEDEVTAGQAEPPVRLEPPARPAHDSVTLAIPQPPRSTASLVSHVTGPARTTSSITGSSRKPIRAPQAVGTYRLSDPIGSGGMATVHLGVRTDDPSRVYAIKRLHSQFSSDEYFVQMLLDEAAIAARIRHANVVTMHGASMIEGDLILVMEYSPGVSLADLMQAAHPETIPAPFVTAIMAGALRGLHAAHEAVDDHGESLAIVHRDVSPHNIHVGVDGVGRVLDFGIAKAAHRIQTTRAGELKGKIAYMAPEQLLSKSVDRRADIRAAAVVLWEALTSSPLFHADSEGATVARVIEGSSTPPSAVVAGIPPRLDEVVLRGLASDPNDRFETALEMAIALEGVFQEDAASSAEISAFVRSVAATSIQEHWDLRTRLLSRGASIARTVEPEVTAIIPQPLAPHVLPAPDSDRFAVTAMSSGRNHPNAFHNAPPSLLSTRGRLILEALMVLTMVIVVAGLAAALFRRATSHRNREFPPASVPDER